MFTLKMNVNIAKENILFLDIETVPLVDSFDKLSEYEQELFAHKTAYQRKSEFTAEAFYQKAGIWAEFGKIICISYGCFVNNQFKIESFFGHNEKKILNDFVGLLSGQFNKAKHVLCGHNAKEFDFPFIARRMLIHEIPLPDKLNLFGKKPWEIAHLDTMELWKFGDYKHYTSLKLLTHVLGIPSPKQDIDGSQVAEVYYKEKNLPKVVRYCEQDVLAVARVFFKFFNQPCVEDRDVVLLHEVYNE